MDDRPIALDPQPPLCVLGCCNVRTWTLIVSNINIISFSLGILFSFVMVLDRDIAPILLWLQVYITLFLIDTVGMVFILVVWTFTDTDKFDIHKKQFIESAFYYSGIIEVISALWIYSVYLYYDFEKKLLRQNRILGRQII